MNLKTSLKPDWQKLLLFLISYPVFTGIIINVIMRVNILSQSLSILSIYLSFIIPAILAFAAYYFSCKIEPIIFKKKKIKKTTIWEIGMLIGIIVGSIALPLAVVTPNFLTLISAPIFLLLKLPLMGNLISNIPCWLFIPICGDEGGMGFFFMVAPIVGGLIMGGIIGFIIDFIYINYKKLKF